MAVAVYLLLVRADQDELQVGGNRVAVGVELSLHNDERKSDYPFFFLPTSQPLMRLTKVELVMKGLVWLVRMSRILMPPVESVKRKS